MLEYWYKERRTLADFRRGPLGPYMDGLAARLKERGYSKSYACYVLGHCCLFNSFLIDQGISRGKEVTPAHLGAFVDAYLADFRTTSNLYVGRGTVRGHLKHLLSYLVDEGVMKPPSPKPLPPQYRWVLEPYLHHLREDRQLDETTIQNYRVALCRFPKGTAVGTRDTAIMLLMMAYGIRGMSVVGLRLEDIDWQRSTILIRARKGGKEVMLPLLEAVGEAIIQYLHHRPETRLREVFLGVKAPYFPLTGQDISIIVRKHMTNAGVKKPKNGSNTLRHSWAIRALAQDSPMKAIADVLGHRCLNTTFIYAKADLKMLRQVTMPWPKER